LQEPAVAFVWASAEKLSKENNIRASNERLLMLFYSQAARG